MEWVDRLNEALRYVEENLCEGIDEGEISRIMACPFVIFQRSFIQITSISLTEYIRRRRLSKAAYEVQNSQDKIIDIALRHGYESPDAFTVAFKRLHGITPVAARKPGTKLKFYSRLYFTLTIKGVNEMDYRTIERDDFTVYGIRRITPTGGGTWGVVKQDGSLERMHEASGKGENCILYGLCFGFDEEGNDDYMVAFEHDKDVPGFDSYTCEATKWLVFDAKGSITEGVLGATWTRIYGEFLPQSGYIQSTQPTIEKYNHWDESTDSCYVEIWIPIKG